VCGQYKICLSSGDLPRSTDDDIVAHDGREAVDLSAQLNLDNLSSLQCSCSLLSVGLEGGIRCDVGARGDGGTVADALGYLLALIYFRDLIFKQLVSSLAELYDVGSLGTPS
jgi:hypothetical protein